MTATQPDPEKRRDRRHTTRIAVGSAVIASLLGAAGSSYTISRQLAGERDQSQTEFLRTQRQATYAELIADVDSFNALFSSALVATQDRLSPAVTEAQVEDLRDSADQVRLAASQIFIIAPLETLSDATSIGAGVQQKWDYVHAAFCHQGRDPAATVCANAPAEIVALAALQEADTSVRAARAAFLLDARKDLDVLTEE